MPIYSNIKEACKKKGISVTKLEMDLGFARSSIYKWDKHQPAIGKIKKVSDYLNFQWRNCCQTRKKQHREEVKESESKTSYHN